MNTIRNRKIISKAVSAAAIAAVIVPATAIAAPGKDGGKASDGLASYEKQYLEVRGEYVDDNGVQAAGRNIVRHGYLKANDEVRGATKGEVVRSTERMKPAPVAPVVEAAPTTETTETAAPTTDTTGAAADSAVVQCESGGDYSAVDPSGTYYGGYQFDQQTWDAYAPEGYTGTNPAEAPPAVQDAAAASVDYDAWPNC